MDLFKKINSIFRKRNESVAERKIRDNSILWNNLERYRITSKSVGCSYSDYLSLYDFVKKNKPREILECGTGFSTIVIAQALIENEKEYGINNWRLISMEEDRDYFNVALNSLPEDLKNDTRLQILLSEAIEDNYDFFRGTRYKEIPRGEYDFVFIDGPEPVIKKETGIHYSFNFDFLQLVRESERPIAGMIDQRKISCFVYSLLFPGKVKYDSIRTLGIIDPVSKYDLLDANDIADLAIRKGWIS
jgi:hypothetical protein